jgi:hypothetical protein
VGVRCDPRPFETHARELQAKGDKQMSTTNARRRIVVEEDVNGATIVNFVDKKIIDEAQIQQPF